MNLKHFVKPILVAYAALFSLITTPHAHAATFTVDRTDDAAISACSATPNDCTLRGAITAANTAVDDDTINFAPVVFSTKQTITLNANFLIINSNITVSGPTASGAGVTIDANQKGGIFLVDSGTVLLSSLTLINGKRDSGAGIANGGHISYGGIVTVNNCIFSANDGTVDGDGGAILNLGSLTVNNSTFSGNTAGMGGGISNFGTATINNSTLYGNTSTPAPRRRGMGGGIYNEGTLMINNSTLSGNNAMKDILGSYAGGVYNGGMATINNSTIYGNSATFAGGLATLNNKTLNLSNSIVAGNSAASGPDISGSVTSQGYNLIGNSDGSSGLTNGVNNDQLGTSANPIAPKLGPFANNGGTTLTYALLPGSPAIDAGNSTLTTDQRGFKRPSGSAPDIGAFEFGSVPTLSVNNPRSLLEGSASAPGSITFDITLSAPSSQSVTINYQTRDGLNNPATAGVDYVEKHGKLTFAPGETLKRVTVKFIGDDKAETKETFFLDLATPTNALITDNRGVGTIANDDATPNVFENDEPSQ